MPSPTADLHRVHAAIAVDWARHSTIPRTRAETDERIISATIHGRTGRLTLHTPHDVRSVIVFTWDRHGTLTTAVHHTIRHGTIASTTLPPGAPLWRLAHHHIPRL